MVGSKQLHAALRRSEMHLGSLRQQAAALRKFAAVALMMLGARDGYATSMQRARYS